MRLAIAVPGNDFRLGAMEAPPAIISMYLGDDMTKFLEAYKSKTFYLSLSLYLHTSLGSVHLLSVFISLKTTMLSFHSCIQISESHIASLELCTWGGGDVNITTKLTRKLLKAIVLMGVGRQPRCEASHQTSLGTDELISSNN